MYLTPGSDVDRRTIFRWWTITGFVIFTLIVVAVFVQQGVITAQARQEVLHSHLVREQIQRVFGRIKDIELGQRGFVLSGDAAYLTPYQQALHGNTGEESELPRAEAALTLWDVYAQLQEMVSDPVQARNVDSLGALIRERVRVAENVIQVRREQGEGPAIEVVLGGEGKRVMDATRGLVAEMLAHENLLLAGRQEIEAKNLRANSLLLYIVVGVFYAAWLFSLWLAGRSRSRRLRAEKQLREQHAHMQALVNSGSYGILSTDQNGVVRLFNPAAEEMLGHKAENLVGRKAAEVLACIHDEEELERRRQGLSEKHGRPVRGVELFTLPLTGTGSDRVWTLIRENGQRFPASVTVSPMHGKDGTFYGYMAILNDITERRRMERELSESNALFKAVINGTEFAIFAADASGKISVFNRSAEKLLGLESLQVVGQDAVNLMQALLPEEVEARTRKLVEKYGRPPEGVELFTLPLPEDSAYGQEWTLMRPDGKAVSVAMTVSLMRDSRENVIGSVALARDISELKANERLKKEFISTVSHELRTPLTSIRGALGLVAGGATGKLPEKAEELVKIAHRNSERLVHIINDILDIDKIESGRLTLYPRPLETGEFLTQVVEVNRPYADKHGIRFVLSTAPEDVWVTADPERLTQVITNLLSNAAKFSPEGSEVRVRAERRDHMLRISVEDDGPGIPEEFRPRLFDKFSQAEGADSRRYEGTGLGLNITKQLVEAMRGSISFETETGKGTVFHVDLPIGAVPVADGMAATRPDVARNPSSASPRILICEDDADVAALLRLLLERAGFEAEVANTLAETRKKLTTGSYTAMTLDLTLPDGSGLDLLKEMRMYPETENLPVVVVSARSDEGRASLKGDVIGLVDWITKPIDEGVLVRSLRRTVGAPRTKGRPRVLHVEDDSDLRVILGSSLKDSADWVGVSTLHEAEERLRTERFDLVVLDLDLPDGSGLELLKHLNELAGTSVPVLILSASETDNGVRAQVEKALVKSRLSEERIVETIRNLIRKHSPDAADAAATNPEASPKGTEDRA